MEQKLWWYTVNNEQKGPVSYEELSLLINQNFISNDSPVWKEGLPNWIKFSEINAQPDAHVPPSPPPNNLSGPPSSNSSYSQHNQNTPPQPNTSYQQTNTSQSILNSQSHTPSVNDRLGLITDFYYRAEFDKIISSNEAYKGKWNWWSFFFSWIWCFAKGLWQYGLAVIICLTLLNYVIPFPYSNVFSFAVAILFGLKGTWFYYNHKIKNKQLF